MFELEKMIGLEDLGFETPQPIVSQLEDNSSIFETFDQHFQGYNDQNWFGPKFRPSELNQITTNPTLMKTKTFNSQEGYTEMCIPDVDFEVFTDDPMSRHITDEGIDQTDFDMAMFDVPNEMGRWKKSSTNSDKRGLLKNNAVHPNLKTNTPLKTNKKKNANKKLKATKPGKSTKAKSKYVVNAKTKKNMKLEKSNSNTLKKTQKKNGITSLSGQKRKLSSTVSTLDAFPSFISTSSDEDPDKKRRTKWATSDTEILWNGIRQHGNNWSEIKESLPNRTYYQVKDKGRRLLRHEGWKTGRSKSDADGAGECAKAIACSVIAKMDESTRKALNEMTINQTKAKEMNMKMQILKNKNPSKSKTKTKAKVKSKVQKKNSTKKTSTSQVKKATVKQEIKKTLKPVSKPAKKLSHSATATLETGRMAEAMKESKPTISTPKSSKLEAEICKTVSIQAY
mmetsp:Transcript_6680/g.8081  ORF Transcript_6680/g.8081 Transcript_6680/m.8081 type:complete len:453 (-) Transcript_6680:54-1412(-)